MNKFNVGQYVRCSCNSCAKDDCSYPWYGQITSLEPNIDSSEMHYCVDWFTRPGERSSNGLHAESDLCFSVSPETYPAEYLLN